VDIDETNFAYVALIFRRLEAARIHAVEIAKRIQTQIEKDQVRT